MEIPGTARLAPANREEGWSTVKRVAWTRQHLLHTERYRERERERDFIRSLPDAGAVSVTVVFSRGD